MVGVQLGERRGRAVRAHDTRVFENQIEEEPAPGRIRGGADDFQIVELAPGVRIGGLQDLGRDVDAMLRERV